MGASSHSLYSLHLLLSEDAEDGGTVLLSRFGETKGPSLCPHRTTQKSTPARRAVPPGPAASSGQRLGGTALPVPAAGRPEAPVSAVGAALASVPLSSSLYNNLIISKIIANNYNYQPKQRNTPPNKDKVTRVKPRRNSYSH